MTGLNATRRFSTSASRKVDVLARAAETPTERASARLRVDALFAVALAAGHREVLQLRQEGTACEIVGRLREHHAGGIQLPAELRPAAGEVERARLQADVVHAGIQAELHTCLASPP